MAILGGGILGPDPHPETRLGLRLHYRRIENRRAEPVRLGASWALGGPTREYFDHMASSPEEANALWERYSRSKEEAR